MGKLQVKYTNNLLFDGSSLNISIFSYFGKYVARDDHRYKITIIIIIIKILFHIKT